MSKKLEKNGMWESSRMMLPEHREAILADNRTLKKLIKPELDDQQIAIIDQALHSAFKSKRTIILTVFGVYKLKIIIGVVLMLDPMLRMVKIILEDPYAENDECVWLAMRDVLKAEIKEVEAWEEFDWD